MTHWSDEQIRTAWSDMSAEDRADIEHHRRRSFGRTPLDVAPSAIPDIDTLLTELGPGK